MEGNGLNSKYNFINEQKLCGVTKLPILFNIIFLHRWEDFS